MGRDDAQFWAMLAAIALAVCGMVLAHAHREHTLLGPHSPGLRRQITVTVKRLMGRDSNSDSDSDSDGDHVTLGERCKIMGCEREHKWITDDDGVTVIRVDVFPPEKPLSPLGAWIREQLLDGTRAKDIVKGAREAGFKASQSTIWRERRRAAQVIKERG